MSYQRLTKRFLKLLREVMHEFGRDGYADFGTLLVASRIVAARRGWRLPPEPVLDMVLEDVLANSDAFVVDWIVDDRQMHRSSCWLVDSTDLKRRRGGPEAP